MHLSTLNFYNTLIVRQLYKSKYPRYFLQVREKSSNFAPSNDLKFGGV